MTAHWLSRMGLFTGMLSVGLLSGCVERRYTIITDPPMAMVLENGRPIGPAPVNKPFDYYGKYRFILQRDGNQTMIIDQDIPAPWWEYPPFDFFVENILPFTIRDIHEFKYVLQQPQFVPEDVVLNRALQIKEKALPLYMPPPPVPPAPQQVAPAVAPLQAPISEAPLPQKLTPQAPTWQAPPPQKLLPTPQ